MLHSTLKLSNNRSSNLFKKILIFILGLNAFIAVGALTAYTINFGRSKISIDPAKWGVFGDFIGGVLNPIISFASLSVTVWIAVMVNRLTEKTSENEIKAQKLILKLQLKYEVLKEFTLEVDAKYKQWHADVYNLICLKDFDNVISTFFANYGYLFEDVMEYGLTIGEEINNIRSNIVHNHLDLVGAGFNGVFALKQNLLTYLRKSISKDIG
ncbi:MAG TPA: hypothetical protein PLS50_07350 [Candidatus Dojkabacteria bacterium]|nr:hypothetical protein [Candidatus Dojkabacteria bacterium]